MGPLAAANDLYDPQAHVDIVETLGNELEAAALALSRNQVTELCLHITAADELCLRLEKIMKAVPSSMLSGGQAAQRRITPEVRAAHIRLAISSRRLAEFLRRCRRSVSLLERHHHACFQLFAPYPAQVSPFCRFSSEV